MRSSRGWSHRRRSAGTSRRSPGPAAPGIDRGGAASGLLDPVRPRTVLRHRALVHAGAHGSLRVRSGTCEACPSPRKVTGGRPTLDRLVEMSKDAHRRFGVYPVYPAMDLEGSREGSPVRRMGSEICGERNSSLVFTRREPRSNVDEV